jgi:hypothetical protein
MVPVSRYLSENPIQLNDTFDKSSFTSFETLVLSDWLGWTTTFSSHIGDFLIIRSVTWLSRKNASSLEFVWWVSVEEVED